MSPLQGSDQAGIIGVGAAVLLGIAAAMFKAANLRGDSNSKWSSRVDLAVLALDEKTVVELRELRDEIDDLLPEDIGPFDPTRVVTLNPAPLSARVEQTARYYKARMRMERNLAIVRRLGRVFVASLALLAVSVVLLTIFYAELIDDWAWIRWAGFASGGLGAITLVASMTVYVVCVDRLAGGEILADTASQTSGSGDT